MVESAFYRGNYVSILQSTVDSPEGVVPLADAAFVIGALCFRGRLDEAEATYALFAPRLGEEARVAARFFLGVALSRHSHHDRGRRLLAENLRAAGRHANARLRFYAWQGAGYFRLVRCRYRESLRCAGRALSAALEANFLYGKALASDLVAHGQVAPGQIQAAGESFRRALTFAELLGDGGLAQAIRVSLVVHGAQHGLSPEGDVAALATLRDELTSEDNYSKSRVLLELGRQHLLRGRAALAKASLDDACRLVYTSQNRRYGIILNLRYATIMHLAGEHHQALNLVRNAAKALDPVVDRQLATEVTGLELRLLEHIPCDSLAPDRAEARRRLAALTAGMGRVVSQRMLDRAAGRFPSGGAPVGDDPLGDLADLAAQRRGNPADPAAQRRAETLLRSGYLQLAAVALGFAPGQSGLAVDPTPGSLLVFDRGEVHFAADGLTPVLRSLLRCLADGHGSKEELSRRVWGHAQYHPLRHDPVVYMAVSRLRQLLGPAAGWIDAAGAAYRLPPGLRIVFHGATAEPPAAGEPGLSSRQLAIVALLKQQSFVDARACSERFAISEVSARRDLATLTGLGVLVRLGKGRATRYGLRAESSH